MAGKAVGRRSVGVAADAASRAGIHPSARRGRGGPRHARRDPGPGPDHHALRARGVWPAGRRFGGADRAGRIRRGAARTTGHPGRGHRPRRGTAAGAGHAGDVGGRRGGSGRCAADRRRAGARADRHSRCGHLRRRPAGRAGRPRRARVLPRGGLDGVRRRPGGIYRASGTAARDPTTSTASRTKTTG